VVLVVGIYLLRYSKPFATSTTQKIGLLPFMVTACLRIRLEMCWW
jgi:hypothetical protein